MWNFLKNFFNIGQSEISCFGRTDTGMVRKKNEDNFCILTERKFFVVADGMGGHKGGEVASRLAIESLVEMFSPDTVMAISGNPEEIRHTMLNSFRRCNKTVINQAEADENLKGMGSTLVACLIDDNTAYVCHVGDVRCYLLDSDRMRQITDDHSIVAEQAKKGAPENAPKVSRSVVTRAIGFPFSQEPDFNIIPLGKNNKLLLCSDGLWSMVTDEEIEKIIRQAETAEGACDDLVSQANQAGGRDNITAVVIFC
jgi:protein phosphatase